jgi:hypothetical protein
MSVLSLYSRHMIAIKFARGLDIFYFYACKLYSISGYVHIYMHTYAADYIPLAVMYIYTCTHMYIYAVYKVGLFASARN